jgi:hypothetical protein
MSLQEKQIILRVLENYIRTGSASDDLAKVICLPLGKTSCVEKIGADGRIIMLDEYKLEGYVIWASYSSRSDTVYLSPKTPFQKPA